MHASGLRRLRIEAPAAARATGSLAALSRYLIRSCGAVVSGRTRSRLTPGLATLALGIVSDISAEPPRADPRVHRPSERGLRPVFEPRAHCGCDAIRCRAVFDATAAERVGHVAAARVEEFDVGALVRREQREQSFTM